MIPRRHSRAAGRRRGGPGAFPLALALLGVPAPAPAQDQPPRAADRLSDEEIRRRLELHHVEQETVRLVQLPVVVTDRKGRLITDLEADDFRLFEDYVPQEIEYFSTDTSERISIAFLLDVSGSMRQVGKLDEAKEAVRVFVDGLRPGDRFGLVCFADDQVAWITEFTSDREDFLRRLAVQEAYGQTALFDAVAAAPRLVDDRIEGRKAIVLITDGNDNASRLNTFSAVTLARSVNVPIYTIGFSAFADRILADGSMDPAFLILRRFSEETGGTFFRVHDPADLKEAVLQVQHELRFQYILGYRSDRQFWDGEFRRIKLEVGRKGLELRTRSGYYATP